MNEHALHHLFEKPRIFQAPMAGAQDTRLALAVCKAGGVGGVPAGMLGLPALATTLETMRQKAKLQDWWAVNFFCHTTPSPDEAAMGQWQSALAPYYKEAGIDLAKFDGDASRVPFGHDACVLVERYVPPIVSFHFGLPHPDLLERVKLCGCLVVSTATTVAEALWLEQNGADAIIAQGNEAGGHRGSFLRPHAPPLHGSLPPEGADLPWGGPAADLYFSSDTYLSSQIGTLALVPQIVAAVDVPVIAAGGIADAAGVRAALALGASAVQVGTAYLCSKEATTSAVHRAALQSDAARHTALTRLFSGRPARGIVNRVMRELGPMSEAAPAFPLASAGMTPLRSHWEAKGSGDFSPLWAGQNVSACREATAAAITQSLAQGLR
ncbi:nitronate monooxygenase [Hydrogenophaga sp. 5NK40-0174]|uniref:NAD(P)H-dependent flavin oxidoreductase n=1 Tax=Hydrogenophaga sp. 5NK40-0174 TaxID=3127649 RepID=UPI00310682D4